MKLTTSALIVLCLLVAMPVSVYAHGDLSIPDNAEFSRFLPRLNLPPGFTEEAVRQLLLSGEVHRDAAGHIYIPGACFAKQADGSYTLLELPGLEDNDISSISPRREGTVDLDVYQGREVRISFRVCGDSSETVEPSVIIPEGKHPFTGSVQFCEMLAMPGGEMCIVQAPACEREPLKRERWSAEHTVHCFDPDAVDPEVTPATWLEEVFDAASIHPRYLSDVRAKIQTINTLIVKRTFLPDGRLLMLVSHGLSGTHPATQRKVSAGAYNLITWSREEGVEVILDDLELNAPLMIYDATLDAVLLGPIEGIEFDTRTFYVQGSGGNPGSSMGRYVGRGFHVVPLGEDRNYSGVLSLSEAMFSTFPDANWDFNMLINQPIFEQPSWGGELHVLWDGERYEVGFDYDSLDLDYDTLTAAQERALGTSDYRADSDGDSLLDQLEVKLFGTDPSRGEDGPGRTPMTYYSRSSSRVCQGYEPRQDTALHNDIRVVGEDIFLRRADNEWVQMGEKSVLSRHKGYPSKGPGDSVFIMTRPFDTANQLVHLTADGQERTIFSRADVLALLDGREAGQSDDIYIKSMVDGVRGLGWYEEGEVYLIDVRTTSGYYMMGVTLEGELETLSNEMLQAGLGTGYAKGFERIRFEFPRFEMKTDTEYVYEWGSTTHWLSQPPISGLGRFGDYQTDPLTRITPKLSDGEFAPANAAIEPGDTLYLGRYRSKDGGLLVDEPQAAGAFTHMLFKFDARGYRAPLWTQPRGEFQRVTGIGYSADGAVCIADHGAGMLREFVVINPFEKRPETPGVVGDVPGIVDCAYDGDFLYTLSSIAPHILKFDRATNEVTEVTDVQVGDGPFQLSIHDGRLLVADLTTGPRTFRSDGSIISLDSSYRVVSNGRTHEVFDGLFTFPQRDLKLPMSLPVQLAERADGLIVGMGVDTPERQVMDPTRTALPNRIALYDLVTHAQTPLTADFTSWLQGNGWVDHAMTVVPGPPLHPCTGDEVTRAESVIIKDLTQHDTIVQAGPPLPPGQGERLSDAATSSDGCQMVVGQERALREAWQGMFLLLVSLMGWRRRRRSRQI